MSEDTQLTEQLGVGPMLSSNVQDFNPGYVQQEYSENNPLYTCVFDDIFHVQHHLLKLLPKARSGFNEFSQQLSQVMLVEDAGDKQKVEAVLATKNKT